MIDPSEEEPLTARVVSVLAFGALTLLEAGCGSGSSSSAITVQKTYTYRLKGCGPTTDIKVAQPTLISFTIVQPDSKPLTRYRHGSVAHTFDHVNVRSDDSHLLDEDADIHVGEQEHAGRPLPGRRALPRCDRLLPATDPTDLANQRPALQT